MRYAGACHVSGNLFALICGKASILGDHSHKDSIERFHMGMQVAICGYVQAWALVSVGEDGGDAGHGDVTLGYRPGDRGSGGSRVCVVEADSSC